MRIRVHDARGGYALAEAEGDAPAAKTVAIDKSNSTVDDNHAIDWWANAFSVSKTNVVSGSHITVKLQGDGIDTSEYTSVTFRVMLWSGGGKSRLDISKEGDTQYTPVNTVQVNQHSTGDDTVKTDGQTDSAKATAYLTDPTHSSLITIPLYGYSNNGKVNGFVFTFTTATDDMHMLLSDFTCNPARSGQPGEIDYEASGLENTATASAPGIDSWKNYDYQIYDLWANSKVNISFHTPIDTSVYPYATFKIMFWLDESWLDINFEANGKTVTKKVAASYDEKQYESEICLNIAELADDSHKLAGFSFGSPSNGTHLLIDNLTCHETYPYAAGKIDLTRTSALISALRPLDKNANPPVLSPWLNDNTFDYRINGFAADTDYTIYFDKPIEVNEQNKFAAINALFWGDGGWSRLKISANDNTETVYVKQGYGEAYADRTVYLPLEKLKNEQNKIESITVRADIVAAGFSSYFLIDDFTITDTAPSVEEYGPGDIDYRLSGLDPVHTVPAWSEVYDYEKMEVLGQSITLEFYEPINTAEYKYAEFVMQIWAPSKWYAVTASANDKSVEIYTIADEDIKDGHLPKLDNKSGIILTDLADEHGMIDSITLTMPSDCGTTPDDDGNPVPRQIHVILSDFTLSAQVPADAVPEAGDIDYKRSGLVKTSENSPVAFWGDVFDYQANVSKGSKLKIIFAEPLETSTYDYAVFNALLWGVPGFIDVPVTTPDGSATLSVYSYWADTVGEINAGNMLARLTLEGLGDANGKIKELTFDFANVSSDGGEFSGFFLFENFRGVNMAVGTAENEKDIAALMPIGANKSFTASMSGEANTWSKQATARTEAYDAISFKLNATYTEHFEFGMLVRTLRPSDSVSKSGRFGGALIELSDTHASVSVWDGDELLASVRNGNFFTSGENVNIKLEILETTLMDTPCGYTLRLTVGDTALDDLYFDSGAVTFGYYTHVLTANGVEAFTATVGSASETPVSAAELMNVKLAATATDGKTKRVPLEFTYNDIGNTQASAPVISGNAHYDATAGYIVFDGEGEVTVKYSVTNDFGTFESNTLTLKYAEPAEKTEVPQSEGGCGGSVGGASIFAAVVILMACGMIVARRRKV